MNARRATIDLNADLGEGFLNDARLLDLVTSASVACGAHAGDRTTILDTIAAARERRVAVGAHPGFPDREGFGRRERTASTVEVERLVSEQVESLASLADETGTVLVFLKPHGALYNQAQRDVKIARGVAAAARAFGLPVLGQPGGVLETAAAAIGLRFVAEGFPDRRYEPDGRLTPRGSPGAVLDDPAEVQAQAVRLVGLRLSTLCIHGDDPRAVDNALVVRAALERHEIVPRFWNDPTG